MLDKSLEAKRNFKYEPVPDDYIELRNGYNKLCKILDWDRYLDAVKNSGIETTPYKYKNAYGVVHTQIAKITDIHELANHILCHSTRIGTTKFYNHPYLDKRFKLYTVSEE